VDSLKNPFAPGAGTPPPELAGRQQILENARIALGRIKNGKPEKSFLLVGLRGVGKTVLLREVEHMAKEMDYRTVFIEAHEDKPLVNLLIPNLRQILFEFNRGQNAGAKVKRALRVLSSFISIVKLKAKSGQIELELSLDIDPERGTADSGDLEADLSVLMEVIGEAAQDRNAAVAVMIDELQYLTEKELSALIMAFHRIAQKNLPLVLVGAGLPQLVGKSGRSKSYAERMFDFPNVGPLQKSDAILALREPVKKEGVIFTEEALEEIVRVTQGYPYFLQEWGYQSWKAAPKDQIDLATVRQANEAAIKRLDENFFRVRLDRLTPREKNYLRALAEFGEETRSGNIANRLGEEANSVSQVRSNLIKKGMIYSRAHGDTAFTVPLFGDFMKRTMTSSPEKNSKKSKPPKRSAR